MDQEHDRAHNWTAGCGPRHPNPDLDSCQLSLDSRVSQMQKPRLDSTQLNSRQHYARGTRRLERVELGEVAMTRSGEKVGNLESCALGGYAP